MVGLETCMQYWSNHKPAVPSKSQIFHKNRFKIGVNYWMIEIRADTYNINSMEPISLKAIVGSIPLKP